MNISEMIKQLEALKEKHGDLPVLIHQEFTGESERMAVEEISAELTQFSDIDWETFEAMEEKGIINSVVITDLPG